jgi:hypothetical protein
MADAAAPWTEQYAGGSQQAEERLIQGFARDIRRIQERTAAKAGKPVDRTLHAKIIVGVQNATLVVDPGLAPSLAAGYFQAGASLPLAIRFSNASPLHANDTRADMRGAALRIDIGGDKYHDLLMTSYPVSHARNAWQFIEVAKIATGPKALVLPRFILKFGLSETLRIIKNVKSGSRPIESIATQQFWSRAPLLWGAAGPVRFSLRPLAISAGKLPDEADPDYLANEFASRVADKDVVYKLALQRYVDESTTPIEDGAVEWRESDSPFIDVATVTIPAQSLRDTHAAAVKHTVDGFAFNPWNCPEPFRPLGGLNRARKRVYVASATGWLGTPPPRPKLD